MNIYTFLLNFRGGTYVSQVRSNSLRSSLLDWSKNIDVTQIQYLGEKTKKELQHVILLEEDPIQLAGLQNVWCVHLMISVGSMLLNIVQTDGARVHKG